MKKDRLFGTDGVRGIANTKLTCKLAFDLGRAAVKYIGKEIVIGRDTRRSGTMLEAALVSGITSSGGNCYLAGIVPTPAVAVHIRQGNYDGGIVISASHNPPEHNGIKFFNKDGFKLTDELEDEIQEFIEQGCIGSECKSGSSIGMAWQIENASAIYVENALKCLFDEARNLSDLKIVIDCGYGASYKTTPMAFEKLGCTPIVINSSWTGDNINVNCGSTDLKQLKEAVIENSAELGIAHDGDADRLLAVDQHGNEVDGDQIESICANLMKSYGLLSKDTVVSTIVCNLGLIKSMSDIGINVKTTDVGDRYVLQEMLDGGYKLGGESSGHMIFLDYNTTGDGLITALMLINAIRVSGKTLDELAKVITKLPQCKINVEVKDKESVFNSGKLRQSINKAENDLGENGRISVRKSGTEDLLRVTVDAISDELASSYAKRISDVIKSLS